MSSSTGLPARGGTSASGLLRLGGLAAVVGGVLSALEPIGEDAIGGGDTRQARPTGRSASPWKPPRYC